MIIKVVTKVLGPTKFVILAELISILILIETRTVQASCNGPPPIIPSPITTEILPPPPQERSDIEVVSGMPSPQVRPPVVFDRNTKLYRGLFPSPGLDVFVRVSHGDSMFEETISEKNTQSRQDFVSKFLPFLKDFVSVLPVIEGPPSSSFPQRTIGESLARSDLFHTPISHRPPNKLILSILDGSFIDHSETSGKRLSQLESMFLSFPESYFIFCIIGGDRESRRMLRVFEGMKIRNPRIRVISLGADLEILKQKNLGDVNLIPVEETTTPEQVAEILNREIDDFRLAIIRDQ